MAGLLVLFVEGDPAFRFLTVEEATANDSLSVKLWELRVWRAYCEPETSTYIKGLVLCRLLCWIRHESPQSRAN
ncbi:hypothetical protein WN72_35965 [Bradyrhizobium arachidis]|uniref:Uncharacterized protein n=1 Tax=Bradyrhizobium arachidis TaxID=858423 RepID=A0AAE7TJ66_9BRAD|nr:hypothetical protein WN72_35965 [Bradyrhizobium arachidis]